MPGSAPIVTRLTRRHFAVGLEAIVAVDADMAAVVERFGPPPLWARPPGFASLVHIILEQQVSLQSARAAYSKLIERIGVLTPDRLLQLDESELRAAGFSRQKASYCRILASAVAGGDLDLARLGRQNDAKVRASLTGIKGIGPWTADIYLLMALRRPNVWPPGDLALLVALQQVKRLRKRPDGERFARLGRRYAPWRAVAARVLWHHYLSVRAAN